MWTRSDLKQRAKNVLSGGYWIAFALCLVVSGVNATISSFSFQTQSLIESFQTIFTGISFENLDIFMQMKILVPGLILSSILMTALRIALVLPATVGSHRFFMDMRAGRQDFSNVLFGFTHNYKNVATTMFWVEIKIWLWSLLLLIPGIIKTYQYYFVPYLMAENPNMSSKRAFELSRLMTNGEKFNIWVMELSFIGWNMLGALLCGIGIMFVAPYMNATMAELYAAMRDKAFYFGFATTDELPGFGQTYQPKLPQA